MNVLNLKKDKLKTQIIGQEGGCNKTFLFMNLFFKGAQTMKCKLWNEMLEFSRLRVPNSRFALHGLALPNSRFVGLFCL